ncbi:hypothetical protein E2P81_ATG11872 [Venturia nashicola]|nr:hypothetical protein E2P81_ATG11872 [Venturia nashicola]
MEYQHGLENLPQIYYSDDFSATSRWPYHVQASASLMSQSPSNKSPILIGIGLHSDTADYDFSFADLNDRYIQGLNSSPFSSELLYTERKSNDSALYPSYDTSFPELHRQCSPLTDGSSSPSQTCDTYSASHADELHHQYSMDFKHAIGSSVEFSQGYLPHGNNIDFARRPSDIAFGGGCSISLDKIQNFQDTAFEYDHVHASSEIDAECDSDRECHNIPPIRQLSIMPYIEDEDIGESIKDESIRDSMSDRFDDEEEEDDPEYNPKSGRRNSKPTRTRPTTTRRNSRTRKLSTSSSTTSRIARPKKTKKSIPTILLRAFPCPLAEYGCQSTFMSKNEWKRHSEI